VSELTAWPVYVSGIVIANLAVIAALLLLIYKVYFQKLGREPLSIAVILLAVWPSSIFFSSFYSESLYLLFVVWSFHYFRRGNLPLSGVTGALVTATRPTGLVLLPAFAAEAIFKQRGVNWRMLWLLLIGAGVAGYSVFCLIQTGDPLFFSHIQHKWGRALVPALADFPGAIQQHGAGRQPGGRGELRLYAGHALRAIRPGPGPLCMEAAGHGRGAVRAGHRGAYLQHRLNQLPDPLHHHPVPAVFWCWGICCKAAGARSWRWSRCMIDPIGLHHRGVRGLDVELVAGATLGRRFVLVPV
jgi:hypothetical protein